MQSRRDQVQAQSYVTGRLVRALVTADPEAPENPHRRSHVGLVIGVVIGVLIASGFLVYGLLVPGGATGWREPGVLILEKETGTRYVFVDGTLYPVLNFASAMMLLKADPRIVTVSSASLTGTPRGTPIGVEGAPDSLPPVAGMDGQVWSACAVAVTDAAATTITATVLRVDRSVAAPASSLGTDRALLVAGPDRRTYLIWKGQRHLVQPWYARALGLEQAPYPVESTWLDAVPVGPDLRQATIPGRGESGLRVNGAATIVGQLFVVGSPPAQRFYLLQRDGLRILTATELAVIVADPAIRTGPTASATPTAVTAAAVAPLPVSAIDVLPDGLAVDPPQSVLDPWPRDGWCIRYEAATGRIDVTPGQPPSHDPPVNQGPFISRTSRTAAVVLVEPGMGGLIREGWPPAAPGSVFGILTDAGVFYPLSSVGVAESLGYAAGDAVVVPPPFRDLVPTGPTLGPDRLVGMKHA